MLDVFRRPAGKLSPLFPCQLVETSEVGFQIARRQRRSLVFRPAQRFIQRLRRAGIREPQPFQRLEDCRAFLLLVGKLLPVRGKDGLRLLRALQQTANFLH